jgi:hypothetical protein
VDPKETVMLLLRLKKADKDYGHLIHPDKREYLQDAINGFSGMAVSQAEYLGDYKGFQDVYRVTMVDNRGEPIKASFYLIKVGRGYQIIDAAV